MKCSCGLLSGSATKAQTDFFKAAIGKEENRRMMILVPPMPSITSKPSWEVYCLRSVHLFNPVEQFSYPPSLICCPSCKAQDSIVKKEFSALRHVHSLAEDCYFSSVVYQCRSCKRSFNAADDRYRLFPPEVYMAFPVVLFHRSAIHRDLVTLSFDLMCSRTTSMASIFAEAIQKRRTGTYLRCLALYQLHCK